LTDDEIGKIARTYDLLLGFTPEIDSDATQGCRILLQDMLLHRTTDGLPYVEPPLTDEDARQRPWVMVRDVEDHNWSGPRRLAAVTKKRTGASYHILSNLDDTLTTWRYARRATPDEIAAAGLEVAE
jgi:hypothetical protein